MNISTTHLSYDGLGALDSVLPPNTSLPITNVTLGLFSPSLFNWVLGTYLFYSCLKWFHTTVAEMHRIAKIDIWWLIRNWWEKKRKKNHLSLAYHCVTSIFISHIYSSFKSFILGLLCIKLVVLKLCLSQLKQWRSLFYKFKCNQSSCLWLAKIFCDLCAKINIVSIILLLVCHYQPLTLLERDIRSQISKQADYADSTTRACC